tara:strand:+ start:72 stop:536 length:465 start_codon:yes stop_codon:yes gene_type:complete
MPAAYCSSKLGRIAYSIEGFGQEVEDLPGAATFNHVECAYLAIISMLNFYHSKWNEELDARRSDIDVEATEATGVTTFAQVATPSADTIRPLPPPLLVHTDNQLVVYHITKQHKVRLELLDKFKKMLHQMTEFTTVKYVYSPDNIATKMLRRQT